jgi:hypothetical protein
MDAQLKAKWVEALLSGRYRQARSALIEEAYDDQPQRFCCLGVLCDAAGAIWTDLDIEQGTLAGRKIRSSNGSFLSPEVLELVGFDEKTQRKLASKNDNGESFEAIAAYIEANL